MSRSDAYFEWTDTALADRAREGDREAFEELVRRHADKVYARAFSMMRSEQEALEVSQEAWIRAWQRLRQFRGNASFPTWMTRIVINLCLDHLRKKKRERSESIEEIHEQGGGLERRLPRHVFDPLEGLEREEWRVKIQEALGRLSQVQRTAIVLHDLEGLEYKEIAKRMNCSIGTVMSRLFYGRRRLAEMLSELREQIAPASGEAASEADGPREAKGS